jgi:hypothetical protein
VHDSCKPIARHTFLPAWCEEDYPQLKWAMSAYASETRRVVVSTRLCVSIPTCSSLSETHTPR